MKESSASSITLEQFELLMDRKLAPMEQQMKKLEPVTEQLANLNSRLPGLEANLQDQADRAVFEGMAKVAIPETLTKIQAKLGQLEQSVGTVQSKIIDLDDLEMV